MALHSRVMEVTRKTFLAMLVFRIIIVVKKRGNKRTQDKRSKPSSIPKPFAYRTLQKYLNPIMAVAKEATTPSDVISSSLLFVPMMGETGSAPPLPPLTTPGGGPASAIVRNCLGLGLTTHTQTYTRQQQTGGQETNVLKRRVCVWGRVEK